MRARDLDRANASSVLDAAYAEGQLGADEYRDRTAQAQAAKTVGELAGLVADLQSPTAVRDLMPTAPTRNPLRRPVSNGSYPSHTRARDTDRATTGDLLDSARRDGQLTEEEHQTLSELAQGAKTLGDLADLVDDLQRPTDAPLPPTPPRSNRRRLYVIGVCAASVCAAVAAFTLTGGVATSDAPHAASVAAAPDLGTVQPVVVATPNLLTREGITHFLAKYREKFGDLQADELTLHDEFATVARAVPGQPNRQIRYDYRGGFVPSGGAVSRKTDTPAADLAQLDVAALSDLLATAPTALTVPNGVVTHMEVGVDTGGYGSFGVVKGATIVRIFAGNQFNESGYFLLTPAGQVVRAWPFKG
ncbi:DUF1707 SHOCT-like domain-containing protein [Nocardia anaemiae]|uniref:DUF1707 SHOCT-like domain-containing protein n=1 Tax=Nocardia anaemiae TaxID=263910 RepID=UPI0007A49559|nr:DUF1707 domain-containing protein [Nocardia anaemiae]